MAKKEPVYQGGPMDKLVAWLEFNMPKWQIKGQEILFDFNNSLIPIGQVRTGDWTESDQPEITMEITSLTYYMVALTNEEKISQDLNLRISIKHVG